MFRKLFYSFLSSTYLEEFYLNQTNRCWIGMQLWKSFTLNIRSIFFDIHYLLRTSIEMKFNCVHPPE